MLSITLSEPGDVASVGVRWRALQAQADGSFFQSWDWVGCLAEERFPDPVLLEAREGGRVVALALFNRRRSWLGERLWLGESGVARLDGVFVEHNGPLIARDACAGLPAACLRAALAAPAGEGGRAHRRLVLSGVDETLYRAACDEGAVLRDQIRVAPCVDFAPIRAAEGAYLGSLSANTRYQLRRSARAYEASGELAIRRAATIEEALAYLDALAVLHQASWTSRGRPGAFAEPAFRRFHRALIARAMPEGTVDLLRVTASGRAIGYLYNFRAGSGVAAYQSGFDYAAAGPHQKPGLTCHHLAIEMYAAQGVERYDFLAGDDRYKTSLANAETRLHWAELAPRRSVHALVAAVRGVSRFWMRKKNHAKSRDMG